MRILLWICIAIILIYGTCRLGKWFFLNYASLIIGVWFLNVDHIISKIIGIIMVLFSVYAMIRMNKNGK